MAVHSSFLGSAVEHKTGKSGKGSEDKERIRQREDQILCQKKEVKV